MLKTSSRIFASRSFFPVFAHKIRGGTYPIYYSVDDQTFVDTGLVWVASATSLVSCRNWEPLVSCPQRFGFTKGRCWDLQHFTTWFLLRSVSETFILYLLDIFGRHNLFRKQHELNKHETETCQKRHGHEQISQSFFTCHNLSIAAFTSKRTRSPPSSPTVASEWVGPMSPLWPVDSTGCQLCPVLLGRVGFVGQLGRWNNRLIAWPVQVWFEKNWKLMNREVHHLFFKSEKFFKQFFCVSFSGLWICSGVDYSGPLGIHVLSMFFFPGRMGFNNCHRIFRSTIPMIHWILDSLASRHLVRRSGFKMISTSNHLSFWFLMVVDYVLWICTVFVWISRWTKAQKKI